MKKIYLIFLLLISLKSIAQLDTCTYVIDTIFKINYCAQGGTELCPPEVVYIDTSLIKIATGLKTYLVCYDPLGLSGSITDAEIGTFNFGDTIPVTYLKHGFNFFNSGTSFNPYVIAIIAVGKPIVLNENFYCYSDIHFQRGYPVDACIIHTNSVYFLGTKNCTVSTCSLNIQNEPLDKLIEIMPNPVINNLTIKTYFSENTSLSIINSIGQTVMTKEKIISTENIDVSFFENGIYFIELKTGTKSIRQKIIINAR